MQPPVVPGTTRLTEGTRVYQDEAARWTGTRQRGCLWSRQQLTQQPEQPGVTGPHTLAPRGLGDVCKAHQHRPRPQAARRQRPQHVGEQPAQQVVGVARPRTRWNAFSTRACSAQLVGKRGTTSVVQASPTKESGCGVTSPSV